MSLEDVLTLPTYHRRAFLSLLAAVIALLVLGDIYILHGGHEPLKVLSEMIGHILAGVVGAVVIAIFLSFFMPSNTRAADLVQLPATEITQAFDHLLMGATRWRFKGNFGRYLRGRVLPSLATKSDVDIDASIIDPTNDSLCQHHAQYRGEIQGIDMGREYTAHDVAREALVTILHCAWHVANSGMSIDLYLTNVFDPLRIDGNEDGFIVTVEDRRKPALKVGRQNFMYDHFATHMRYSFQQGRKIDLTGFAKTKSMQDVTQAHVDAYLGKIGMSTAIAKLGTGAILRDFKANRNPYAT